MEKIKYIKVYGERNTGTNYFNKLLSLNFDIKLLRGTVPSKLNTFFSYFPFDEKLRDLYFLITDSKNLGWKHREIDHINIIKKSDKLTNTLFITISKNPYSFLLSLHKRPYHNKKSAILDFNVFIQQKWKSLKRESKQLFYANATDLWNKKNKSYLNLQKFNCLNITYEDLVISPEKIMLEISKKINKPFKNKEFVNYESAIKIPDQEKNYDYYKELYGKELWRNKLSDNSIKIINGNLDENLLKTFDYKKIEI